MVTQVVAPLYLLWDALAVLGILCGLLLLLAGYRVFERAAELPGLVLGALITGGLAYLLWHDPLPTIAAAAIGGWVGARIIRDLRTAIIFAGGAWVGLLVALASAALLAVLTQRMPAPSLLLLLFVVMPVVGGFIALHHNRLMITLATAFSGAGLIVGGLARLVTHASGGYPDVDLPGAMLLGSLVLGVVGVIVQYRGPAAREDQSAGSTRSAGKHRTFRNPSPEQWHRPYPEVLPSAISMRANNRGRPFNSRWVTAMAMASDGSRLAVGLCDGAVYLVSPKDGGLLWQASVPASTSGGRGVTGLAVGRQGSWLAIVGQSSCSVYLWNPNADVTSRTGPITVTEWGSTCKLSPSLWPSNLAVSNDERWFITSHASSRLWLGELSASPDASPQLNLQRTGERGSVTAIPDYLRLSPRLVAFHPDGRWLLVTDQELNSDSSNLYFYDVLSDEWFSDSYLRPGSCAWGWGSKECSERAGNDWTKQSYGDLLSAWLFRNMCGLWFVTVVFEKLTGKAWSSYDEPTRMPRSVHKLNKWHSQLAVSADGSVLGVLCGDSVMLFTIHESGSLHGKPRIRLRDLRCIVPGAKQKLDRIAFSPDGRHLAASSNMKDTEGRGNPARIHIWSVESGRLECELTSYEEERKLGDFGMEIHGLAFHPNGRWLFSAGHSGVIRRWTLAEDTAGGLRATCDMAMEPLPDGQWVVWRDPDGPSRCWVNPSPAAQRWLGWRMPSGGDFAEYRPFDAFKC